MLLTFGASSPSLKPNCRQASRAIITGSTSSRETQDDIAQLRERNLKLEDALALAHSRISEDAHPLLSEFSRSGRSQGDPEVDKVTEVLGVLTVSEVGEHKYFGPSSGIEPLHQAAHAKDEPLPLTASPLPNLDPALETLSALTPLGCIPGTDYFVSTILNDLPEKRRAWSLCEIFFEHYPIYSMPIQENDLMQGYLLPMYKYLEDSRAIQNLSLPLTTFRPHRCATIFFIFSIAAWLDVTNEHYWVEADRYFQIGLSCLSMQSILYSAEVASVHALFLLAYYNELRGAASTSTLSPGWTILSLACKISQGLGLHRDPAQWDLDKTEIRSRRWLYWELISMEVFHCLGTGRPLSCRPSYIDTELPDDMGRTDAHGAPLQGFFRWKHEAMRGCYLDVVERLLTATPAKYEVILELDRKVRMKEIPAHLNRILVDAEDGPNITAPEFMHTCMLGVARSMVLLSIHRHHLTEALKDSSSSPLKSRYAPSFLASYRAASWIIKSYHAGQRRFPTLFGRLWHPWTAVLTAAMVLGSIAIHAPSSPVGNSPLEELSVASFMFEDAAARTVSHRTKNGAKIVQKILARARAAQAQYSAGDADVVQSGISIPPTSYGDDELAIFGGQDRLLAIKAPSRSPQYREDSPSNFSSSAVSPGHLDDIHPSLVDFLATAPMTQVASATTFQEIQATTFGLHSMSPFHNPGLMLQQPDGRASRPLSTSHTQYHVENTGGPSTSGLQNWDTFENYLTPTPPVDLGTQPNVVTPWQDFMMQHSLT
ncbi:hypothetical protein DL96DRAFT_1734271 [Flagelloscypha sp. PMI_526]|nr:hypothetical protein DL96DRAFT_1734271 [Flagelloscypha sp. PMI_526]